MDARSLIAAGGGPRDVVLSEPSNLWRAGVSNLFTEDFYASARGALKRGGIFAQWLQLYGLRWETLRTILATIARSFPDVEVWWLDGSDVILLGAEAPIVASRERVEALLAGTYGEDLRKYLATPEPSGFWARYLLGRADLEAVVGDGARINTDDRPVVEFAAPRDLFRPGEDNAGRLLEEKISRGRFAPPLDGTPPTSAEAWSGLAGMYGMAGRPALARAAALRAFDEAPDPALALRAAWFAIEDGAVDDAEADLARARALGADPARAADLEGRLRTLQGRVEEAMSAFARADLDGKPGLERLTLLALYGDEDAALDQADRLLAARARGSLAPGDAARVVEDATRSARSTAGAVRVLASIERHLGHDAVVPRIPVLEARGRASPEGGPARGSARGVRRGRGPLGPRSRPQDDARRGAARARTERGGRARRERARPPRERAASALTETAEGARALLRGGTGAGPRSPQGSPGDEVYENTGRCPGPPPSRCSRVCPRASSVVRSPAKDRQS